jgi:transposase
MGAPVAIRTDMEATQLRRLARRERDGRVSARLIALANVLDGLSRGAAARAAGMDRQTLRDWVIRFNAEGVEGLRDQPRSGRRPWMSEGQQATLKAIVLRDPDPDRDGVSTWRLIDLCRIAEERFGVSYREGGMRRLVKALDLSWQKIRPRPRRVGKTGSMAARHAGGAGPREWTAEVAGEVLEEGDRVMHPAHGVGRVERIAVEEVSGFRGACPAGGADLRRG